MKEEHEKTFCKIHQEIELREDYTIGDDEDLTVNYYVHPCPACLLDARYERSKEIRGHLRNFMDQIVGDNYA